MLWISRSMSRDRSALREQAGRAICVPLRGSCPGPGCSGFWRLAEPSLALVRDGVACLCVNVQQWDIPAASFHFHSAYHVTAIPSPRNTYATHSPWATHDDRHHRRDPWFSVGFSFNKHRARQEPRLLPSHRHRHHHRHTPWPTPTPPNRAAASSWCSSAKQPSARSVSSIPTPCRTQVASRLTSVSAVVSCASLCQQRLPGEQGAHNRR